MREHRQADIVKNSSFFWSIKGNIISYVAICTVIIIAVTATLNSIVMRNVLITDGHNTLTEEAENTGNLIDEWLIRQAYIVDTMKSALATMQTDDMEAVMDYLEVNLAENPDALMYYCCLAYENGAYPADHTTIPIDPTTRSWWIDAVETGGIVYTEPYTDLVTGKMVISIATPFIMDGEQAVVLADITIDSLIEMVQNAGTDESVQTFLLASDNSVITHENEEYLPKEEGNTILSDVLDMDLASESVSIFKDYDGVSKYYVVREIESTGWRIGITQPTSVISSQIRSNLILPLVTDLVLLAAFIILLNIVVNRL